MRRGSSILAEVWREVRRARRRSLLQCALAAFAIVLPLVAVHAALAARARLLARVQALGARVLLVTPHAGRNVAARVRTGAVVTARTPADARALRRSLLARGFGVAAASAWVSGSFTIQAGDLAKKGVTAISCQPDFWRSTIGCGRAAISSPLPTSAAARASPSSARASPAICFRRAMPPPPSGARLLVNRVPFRVVGVLAPLGAGRGGAETDEQIYVPLRTGIRRLLARDYYQGILFLLAGRSDMASARSLAQALLRRRHPLGGPAAGFPGQDADALIATLLFAARQLERVALAVALAALGLAGFAVLAVRWMSVGVRQGELGTRRALGARRADLLAQIVAEAALMALAGALVGGAFASLDFRHPTPCFATLLVAVLATQTLFAVAPAARAALLSPAAALRQRQ